MHHPFLTLTAIRQSLLSNLAAAITKIRNGLQNYHFSFARVNYWSNIEHACPILVQAKNNNKA
ncbi:MAG: hypothetical protein ACI832_000056 [Rheinheimera aquimaris]|jgi:hypothetical protein|tara:strand:- start:240 stop:428 length:189 start_codon:yes stop_codon:yes gene_type:complete